MKNVFLTSCILLSAFIFFQGCSDSDRGQTGTAVEQQTETAVSDLQKRVQELEREGIHSELESLVSHFRREGLDVGDVHMKAYELIGAVGGIGLELEGGTVELYLFDPATADEAVADKLGRAKETGVFDHPSFPVVMNGNIMLLGLQAGQMTHPEKDRIIEVFERY